MRILLFSSVPVLLAIASNAHASSVAFPGYSGLFITPTAEIANQGEFTYQYNSYGEDLYKNLYEENFNHIFTFGLHPNVEIGGRLTNYYNPDDPLNANGTKKGKRDLSGNIKVQLPKLHHVLPDIAVGANDVAGEAVNFSSQYVVASKKIGKGQYSLGYATGDNTDFNGVFASAKYDFYPGFTAMSEYIAKKYKLGFEYNFDYIAGIPLSIKANIPVSSDSESLQSDTTIGISYAIPLDLRKKRNNSANKNYHDFKDNIVIAPPSKNDFSALVRKLDSYGFEDIAIGKMPSGNIIISVDNKVYNHNFMDGLALILGSSLEYVKNNHQLTLVLLDNNKPKLAVATSLSSLKTFIEKPTGINRQRLSDNLKVWYPKKELLQNQAIQWINNTRLDNKTKWNIRIQPDVKTAVGTEWGVFDYSLALRADVDVPVWNGGNLHATIDLPLEHSDLFSESGVFSASKHELGINQLLLQQTFKPTTQATAQLSAGLMNVNGKDHATLHGEGILHTKQGDYQLRVRSGYFKPKDGDAHTVVVGALRKEWTSRDLAAEVSYGQYFDGDRGVRVDLTKRFGDTELSAFVKYIGKQDIVGGLELGVPLTPRRDYKKGKYVIRGNERWRYRQTTTIKDSVVVGSNRIRPNMMLEPQPRYNLKDDYYENNLMTPSYVRSHIPKLRESYLNLRKD